MRDVISSFQHSYQMCFFRFISEREKQVLIKGDEPTVQQQSRRSLNSNIDATGATPINEGINSLTISDFLNSNEDNVQLPSVGRWGCEWPS